MTHWLDHSLVLASDYRVAAPEHVKPLLERNRDALAHLGAHHILIYESTTEPGRVLVMIAIHTRDPVLELLRSRTFFDWFDAVGVTDFPAVFAGEEFARHDLEPPSAPAPPEVMVSVVTPVDDLAVLRSHVRGTLSGMRAAGVRKLLLFNAFDDPLEVMMLLQIDDEEHARHWLEDSEVAAEWLAKAGIGAYPPVFIGRFLGMVRIDESEGTDDADDR